MLNVVVYDKRDLSYNQKRVHMTTYCITAANHSSSKDDRASEFKVWEYQFNAKTSEWIWSHIGKRTLHQVAALLAAGHEVISAKEVIRDGNTKIVRGAAIEISLRIAKNDDQFKITDLPVF